MKVRDIQIDGFGVWSGLSVDSLPDGMTVFYGPNEAGKTTLMQFLRTMLYGFTAERRQRYLPPVFPGKPGGAMRVSGPGGGYEIARRATLNDPSIVGQLTVTSSDGVTQGQHRLTSLLGSVDESIFTNVFAIGLRELISRPPDILLLKAAIPTPALNSASEFPDRPERLPPVPVNPN